VPLPRLTAPRPAAAVLKEKLVSLSDVRIVESVQAMDTDS
jgi:hypothetical protein